MPAKIGGAGRCGVAVADEEERGVGDLLQPGVGHLEDADLGGRPEAVLHRAEQAEMLAGVALEIEHRVDHVLDHARAGDLPVLGDVADEHDCVAPLALAKRISACTEVRTCVTVPGALSAMSVHSVWIESMTTRSTGGPACSVARMSSTCVSAASATGASRRPRRSARSRICPIASSPET